MTLIAFIIVLLVVPVVVAFVFLINAFWKRERLGFRPVKIWTAIIVLVLLLDPLSQRFLLGGLDTWRGTALAKRAYAAGIVGMDQDQVRALLGEPSRVRDYRTGGPTWEYKQIPGYWFGSYFQVFFKFGVVQGVEANDD